MSYILIFYKYIGCLKGLNVPNCLIALDKIVPKFSNFSELKKNPTIFLNLKCLYYLTNMHKYNVKISYMSCMTNV